MTEMTEAIEVKNEAKLALKDMPEDEALKIFRAWLRGQELEAVYWVGRGWQQRRHTQGALSYSIAYRTAPITLVPDTIDVSHVHQDFRWMARDKDGSAFIFEEKPHVCNIVFWNDDKGTSKPTTPFASYTRGTVPWDESLVDLDALRRERGIPVKGEE